MDTTGVFTLALWALDDRKLMKNKKTINPSPEQENATVAFKCGWREGIKISIIALLISLAII